MASASSHIAGTSQEEDASTAGLLTRNEDTAVHPFFSRNERGEAGGIWPVIPSLLLLVSTDFPLALLDDTSTSPDIALVMKSGSVQLLNLASNPNFKLSIFAE